MKRRLEAAGIVTIKYISYLVWPITFIMAVAKLAGWISISWLCVITPVVVWFLVCVAISVFGWLPYPDGLGDILDCKWFVGTNHMFALNVCTAVSKGDKR